MLNSKALIKCPNGSRIIAWATTSGQQIEHLAQRWPGSTLKPGGSMRGEPGIWSDPTLYGRQHELVAA